jgi:release factor glutamine methyltransferase
VLLSHTIDKPKEYLLSNPEKKVDPKLEKKFLILLNRRLLGWPVAYLRKQKEFHGLRFYMDKNVLIPRPETEGLVDLVLSQISNLKPPISILDIGTGSGNIIISLAKKLSAYSHEYVLYASDISPKAVAVARKNARLHKTKIKFAVGNLLEAWGKQKFDVIIANLPYLARQTDSSTKFEPIGALIAAKKGLAFYEKLFKQISSLYPQPSTLLLEIGHDQGFAIKKLARNFLPASPAGGPAYETKIFKDLAARPRFAVLVKKSS